MSLRTSTNSKTCINKLKNLHQQTQKLKNLKTQNEETTVIASQLSGVLS